MTTIPDFDLDRARDDFECIFDSNSLNVTRIRDSDDSAGDLFNEDGASTRSKVAVAMNIQGISSAIQRLEQGVSDRIETLHAFAKYNTDLIENDIILVNTSNISIKFKINNYAPGMKGDNQFVFQEFDLVHVDHNFPDSED